MVVSLKSQTKDDSKNLPCNFKEIAGRTDAIFLVFFVWVKHKVGVSTSPVAPLSCTLACFVLDFSCSKKVKNNAHYAG